MEVLVSKMTKKHILCELKLWIGYDEMVTVLYLITQYSSTVYVGIAMGGPAL